MPTVFKYISESIMDVNLTKPNSKNKASKANTTSTSKNYYKVTTCYAVYGNIYIEKKKRTERHQSEGCSNLRI